MGREEKGLSLLAVAYRPVGKGSAEGTKLKGRARRPPRTPTSGRTTNTSIFEVFCEYSSRCMRQCKQKVRGNSAGALAPPLNPAEHGSSRSHIAAFGRNQTRRKRRARHVTFRVRKLGTGRRARRENTPSQIHHKPNRRLGLVCLARLFLREKEDLARL